MLPRPSVKKADETTAVEPVSTVVSDMATTSLPASQNAAAGNGTAAAKRGEGKKLYNKSLDMAAQTGTPLVPTPPVPPKTSKVSSFRKKFRMRFAPLDTKKITEEAESVVRAKTPNAPVIENHVFRYMDELMISKSGFRRKLIDEKICEDDFVITKVLGRGAGGIVYKGIHRKSLRIVAIKQVKAGDVMKATEILTEITSLTENFESLSADRVPLRSLSNLEVVRWLFAIHFALYSKQIKFIDALRTVSHLGAFLEAAKFNDDSLKALVPPLMNRKLLLNLIRQVKTNGGIKIPSECPYIVSFHGAYLDATTEKSVCIVLEYMDGGDLQQFVDNSVRCRESLIASISFRVLKGLEFIHARHQIHRDIKPANALITQAGEVKVSDFGIAKSKAAEDLGTTMSTTFKGTTLYMSPERLVGKKYYKNADVWSLGITVMALYLGNVPYSDHAQRAFFDLLGDIGSGLPKLTSASEHLQAFLQRCLEPDPEKRASVKELLGHVFIREHVDQIYDTRNYKKWVRDRREATMLNQTKGKSPATLLKDAEKQKKKVCHEMKAIAEDIVKNGGGPYTEQQVKNLAEGICGKVFAADGIKRFHKTIKKAQKKLRKAHA